jgi:hypothetical protein
MVGNEMFLDTAVLRQTVVSHAKALGYTGISTTSAQALVNVDIIAGNTNNTSVLTLPRFTSFSSAALNGTSYNFVTLDSDTATVNGNTFTFANTIIAEGAPTVVTFIQDNTTNPSQFFDLTDANVDTSTIQVIVQASPTNIQQTLFVQASDVINADANANIYFLQEGTNGNYQIYFGDGIIGSQVPDGGVVIVSYVVSSGNAANDLQTFTLNQNPLSGGTSNIQTITASAGGSPQESITSIKFNAPKSYIAQNRAVTINDYITLINKNYPFFDAVNVWGGETMNPPQYGMVFISGKPKNGYVVTQAQQQFVIDEIIAPISIVTVTAAWVNTDYNYIVMTANVEYDSTQTQKTPGEMENMIVSAVNNYANLNLNTFNSEFRMSRMLRAIDDSEPSIEGSDAAIWIEKQFTPTLNVSDNYTLNIGFPLMRGSINDGLYSTPAFTIVDASSVSRQAFIEEVPDSSLGLEQVTVVTPGSGYLTPPTLIVDGDGTGANAYAVVVNGRIANVVIDNPGSEYTSVFVSAQGTTGTGATFNAYLQGQTGTLRSYYFDTNNIKNTLNPNAGTIDYLNGIITLNNFQPTAVASPYGILKLLIQPAINSFSSENELILTIDPNDQNAITVQLTDISAST